MFPLSAEGQVEILSRSQISVAQLTQCAEVEFRALEPTRMTVRGDDSIEFKAGLRWVDRNNLLLPWYRGSVHFRRKGETLGMSYRLSFVQMFIISAAAGYMVGVMSFSSYARFAATVCVGWMLCALANYSIGLLRFRRFLKKMVQRTEQSWAVSNRG